MLCGIRNIGIFCIICLFGTILYDMLLSRDVKYLLLRKILIRNYIRSLISKTIKAIGVKLKKKNDAGSKSGSYNTHTKAKLDSRIQSVISHLFLNYISKNHAKLYPE